MKKDAQALFQLAVSALQRAGANPRMAQAAARHLVAAEEQGLPTHGMSRVPFYCGMLRKGRADGAAAPRLVADRGAVCLLDNADGLPYVTAQWAVEELIQRARRNGIGFAGITNSSHVGVLGIHLVACASGVRIADRGSADPREQNQLTFREGSGFFPPVPGVRIGGMERPHLARLKRAAILAGRPEITGNQLAL